MFDPLAWFAPPDRSPGLPERPLDLPYGPRALGATSDPGAAAPPGFGPIQRLAEPAARPPLDPIAASVLGGEDDAVHAAAAHGTRGPGEVLPHLDAIQHAFGRHDVTGVSAHVGGPAAEGAAAMGAEAFATGHQVAFARSPDLHTAAHEAAHVIQQRAGVHLQGGVGAAGDGFERHADAVADRVVAGQSAEDLLDQHAGAGGGRPAVQKVIAKTPAQLQLTLGHADILAADMTTVGDHITLYNQICQQGGMAQGARVQLQLDQLRVLDRACYAAIDRVSRQQFEIKTDPRVMALHDVLQQSESEHRVLVQMVAHSPALRGQVDAFDINGVGVDQDDLSVQETRALWASVMDGTGKLKVVGRLQYRDQVRSWLTKLMDTKQGRRLLRYLNTGDQTQLGTNVYIGELLQDLPQGVQILPNKSGDLEDRGESVAQPLLDVDTRVTASPNPLHNPTVVGNAEQFNDTVLDGGRGVRMGGQDYAFGQSSGSFVNISDPGELSTASGVDRQPHGHDETPEIYQPDWVVLGHELGHSANMRAGATTDGRKMIDNPTDVFAEQFTGNHDRTTRQDQWYGGSEEYINITGNENRLREQGGLDERGAHTSAGGREMQRREPAIQAAFREITWAPLFCPQSPTEKAYYDQNQQQKRNILTAFTQSPRSPLHLQNATNLGNATVAWFQQRQQERQMRQQVVNQVLAGDAARNALDPNRRHEAQLQGQYDLVKRSIVDELAETPTSNDVGSKAQRIVNVCQEWVQLRTAHDQAGLGTQFKLKAWWDRACSSLHNVGARINAGDTATYVRKLQRIIHLRNDYLR